jgi:hypothetical protein
MSAHAVVETGVDELDRAAVARAGDLVADGGPGEADLIIDLVHLDIGGRAEFDGLGFAIQAARVNSIGRKAELRLKLGSVFSDDVIAAGGDRGALWEYVRHAAAE